MLIASFCFKGIDNVIYFKKSLKLILIMLFTLKVFGAKLDIISDFSAY